MGAEANSAATPPAPRRRARGALVALAAGIAVALVYLATLAPALTFSHFGVDGGDLIAAARTLGVPHPTGYPTYTILARVFTALPVGTVAFRVNLLSAACAGGAAALVCRIAQEHLTVGRHALLLSVATAMTAAFSPLLWSQAVISEVYALHALFSAVLVWLLLRWHNRPDDPTLGLAAFVFGLGLGNHLTLALLLPAALLVLLHRRRAWFNLRAVGIALSALSAGLAVYLYLPIAASHRPAVNWGDARSLDRFLWLVTASPYWSLSFGLKPSEMLTRASDWSRLMGDQFGWWGLAIAMAGAWRMSSRDRHLAAFVLLWALATSVWAFCYGSGDAAVYLIPLVLAMALWWHEGASYLLDIVSNRPRRWQALALASLCILPLVSLGRNWQRISLKSDWAAQTYAVETLESAGDGGLIIVLGDKPTFALWYAAYAEHRRPDVAIVNGSLLAYEWYRSNLRDYYPTLSLPVSVSASATSGDWVRELIAANYMERPIYATDPADDWRAWFDFEPMDSSQLFLVRPKTIWEVG